MFFKRKKSNSFKDVINNEYFNFALNSANIGVWEWRPDSDIETRDANFNKILGLKPISSTQSIKEFIDRIYTDDKERIEAALENSIRNNSPYEEEFRIIREDDQVIWVVEKGNLFIDRNTEKKYMIGVIIDVTYNKELENELTNKEELFQKTFKYANIGIANISREGKWIRVNEKLCSILGYTENEFMELTFQELTHPDDIDKDLELTEKVLNGEIPSYTMEKRYFHKSGRIIWVNLTVSGIGDPEKNSFYFVATIDDIDEKKRDEEKIRDLNKRMTNLIDNLPGIVYRCENTKDWPMTYLSPNVKNIIGYSAEEFYSKKISFGRDIILHEDQDRIWSEVQKAIQNKTSYDFTYKIKNKTGQIRYVWEQGRPIYNDDNEKLDALDGIIFDVTKDELNRIELKKALDELSKSNMELALANEHKKKFISHMSHELRTPLNAVIGFTDLIKNGSAGTINDKQKDYLHEVMESAKYLLKIINSVLNIVKIDSKNFIMELNIADPDYLLSKALDMISYKFKESDIVLKKNIPDNIDFNIRCDIEKTVDVIVNLLDNSIKNTPPKGKITASISRKGGFAVFSVSDNGSGIDPKYKDIIFKEFEQVKRNDFPPLEGIGLGLAISKIYIEKQGGSISYESKPDQGSSFKFTLPIYEKVNEDDYISEQTSCKSGGTLLIAGDDKRDITLLKNLADLKVKKTLLAENDREAVEISYREKPDIIIMDLNMSITSSIDTTKKIRSKLKDTPIIILSEVTDGKTIKQYLDAGATDYIIKPVTPKSFYKIFNKYLKYKK